MGCYDDEGELYVVIPQGQVLASARSGRQDGMGKKYLHIHTHLYSHDLGLVEAVRGKQ